PPTRSLRAAATHSARHSVLTEPSHSDYLHTRRPPAPTLLPYTTLFRSRQSEHSRLPVYDGTPDNIVGIVFAKDFEPHAGPLGGRSEEHTSELQSRVDLVCRLLLEKKNPSSDNAPGRVARDRRRRRRRAS